MPWVAPFNYTGRASLTTHEGPFVDFDASVLTGEDGSPVTDWYDAGGSGIGLHTDRGTPTLRLAGQNGLNVVDFNESTLMARNPDHWRFLHRDDHTLFCVYYVVNVDGDPDNNQNLVDTGGDVQIYRGYTLSWEDRSSRTPPRNNMARVSINRGGSGPNSPGDGGLKYLLRVVPENDMVPPGVWTVLHTRVDSGTLDFGVNGFLLTGTTGLPASTFTYNGCPASGPPLMPLRIGDNYDSLITDLPVFPLVGSIGQIVIYDRALSDPDFDDKLDELMTKWAVTA